MEIRRFTGVDGVGRLMSLRSDGKRLSRKVGVLREEPQEFAGRAKAFFSVLLF